MPYRPESGRNAQSHFKLWDKWDTKIRWWKIWMGWNFDWKSRCADNRFGAANEEQRVINCLPKSV